MLEREKIEIDEKILKIIQAKKFENEYLKANNLKLKNRISKQREQIIKSN